MLHKPKSKRRSVDAVIKTAEAWAEPRAFKDTVINFGMTACGQRSAIAAELICIADAIKTGCKLGYSGKGDAIEFRWFTDE